MGERVSYLGKKYDNQTGLYGDPYDPLTGMWLTPPYEELSYSNPYLSALGNVGLNIITFGMYGAIDRFQNDVPATWGEVGLQTLDATPVVGSIKGAIQSDSGLERYRKILRFFCPLQFLAEQ